jgi:hypothetical protein
VISRTRMKLEALVTRLKTELVSTLIVEYALRLKPTTLEKFDKLFRAALDAARLIGQLHAARPYDQEPLPETEDELADTRPMRTRPPPPPKPKA